MINRLVSHTPERSELKMKSRHEVIIEWERKTEKCFLLATLAFLPKLTRMRVATKSEHLPQMKSAKVFYFNKVPKGALEEL